MASADLSEGLSRLKSVRSPSLPKFPTSPSVSVGISSSATVLSLSHSSGPSTSSAPFILHQAGEQILQHYSELWSETHELSEANVAAADRVSKHLNSLTSIGRSRSLALLKLNKELGSLPTISQKLSNLTKEVEKLSELAASVEAGLAYLEVLNSTAELQERRLDARFSLAMLREEKVAGLNQAKEELTNSFYEAEEERERRRAKETAEKAALYAQAASHDLGLYRATGLVTNVKMEDSGIAGSDSQSVEGEPPEVSA